MSLIDPPAASAGGRITRQSPFVGPWLEDRPGWMGYLAATAVVLTIAGIRAALSPIMGTQSPLLPFVLGVFISAYIGGRGPALWASVLTPLLATLWFTHWPNGTGAFQWGAHVVFFLTIGVLVSLLMQALQTAYREQAQALAAARETARQVQESEARLRLVTDHLPVLVSYVDREEIFRFTNAAYREWFERDPAHPPSSVRKAFGEAAYAQRAPYVQAVLRGELVRFEGTTTHRTLGERLVEITYVPERAEDGNVQGFYVMGHDITERHKAQQALQQANERKDQFLAMLAHELRNPLAPIRNVAHLLSTGTLDAGTVRRSSEILQRQATQLTRLVDDLLDVARITRGAIELKTESLDLERVLDAALESAQPLINVKHQTVALQHSAPPVYVEGDPVRLCQVFGNLIANAAKFSPDHTNISITLESTADQVTVAVADAGIGIDPQILPHLFDLFLQGDQSLDRAQGGLGIGLTVVKYLVDMHGGHVEARSAGVGHGSEFRVQLPRIPAPSVQPSASRPGRPPAPARRVLVVEDSVDSATSLALLLESAGHEIRVTHDGAAALAALEHFASDVILLDIGLPGMDGYMVAQSIRTRFPKLTSRLYAMTGYGSMEDRELALAAGFDDHLTKPVDPERLLQLIADPEAIRARS